MSKKRSFINKILFVVNIVAVLLLFTSYSALFISPESRWIPSFMGLAYPLTLAINLFFILYWLFSSSKKSALLSVVSIIIGWGILTSHFQFKTPSEELDQSRSFSVMTYNVRNYNFEWKNGAWDDKELEQTIGFLKMQTPDYICLQETFLQTIHMPSVPKRIKERLGYTSYVYNGYHHGMRVGLAIISKDKIIDQGTLKDDNGRIYSLWADIKTESDTFRIYNIHLQSIGLKDEYSAFNDLQTDFYKDSTVIGESKKIASKLKHAFTKRAFQADSLNAHLERCPYPVIVAGDMNDTPCSYAYKKIKGKKQDAFREAGFGTGRTYHGKYPSFRIDYVFSSDDYNVIDYEVDKREMSDHYPLIVTVERQ